MTDVTFRRLQRSDYSMLAGWLEQPHVKRWWNHDSTPEAIEADFGACIDRVDLADIFIALWDGRPAGLIQSYLFGDNPGYMDEVSPLVNASPEALSIDYFVGEPDLLRQGVGAAIIRALVDDIWRDYPAAPSVIVPVNAANPASWRVLENAGFERVAEGPLSPDNPIDDWAHFVYRIRRPSDAAQRQPEAEEFPADAEGGQSI